MHDHTHEHEHQGRNAADNRRRLTLVLILTGTYLVAEAVGGWLTNSLALLSDAGHMLTDVAALGLALFAIWFAQRPATAAKTYGYSRLEILAALLNGLVLLGLSVFIILDAIRRIQAPEPVQGAGLLAIATGGLAVNIIGAWVLHQGHGHSLNVRAAFYHLIGDLLGSLGAVVAGVLILAFGWYIADPILAIGISVLIIVSAFALVREAMDVLLEATPRHLNLDRLGQGLLQLEGVVGIHDLHVWTITSGMYALSVHVVVDPDHYTPEMLDAVRIYLHDHFDLSHQTVQLETPDITAKEAVHMWGCWGMHCERPEE